MAIRSFEDHTPVIAQSAYIDETALVIGDVSIGEHSSLWPMVVARGDVNTNIQDGSILHGTHDGPFSPGGYPLSIGDRVTVGHEAILHACRIEDDCLIGMRARFVTVRGGS